MPTAADTADTEIRGGTRFAFGRNWASFLETITEERIAAAEQSLLNLLQAETLTGRTFLDIGSGSGLFSLAARRLGAGVTSLDFDPQSVACTQTLRNRSFPGDLQWQVIQGSILDDQLVQSLPPSDVVYSWGVLHHTGAMWTAIDNAARLVHPGGLLAIALYNDQGFLSRVWLRVKQVYCGSLPGRWLVSSVFVPWFFLRTILASIVKRTNLFRTYRSERGMSLWHDWHDWLGGLPFEVARPEAVLHTLRDKGFELVNLVTTNNLGCNQFVFRRQ